MYKFLLCLMMLIPVANAQLESSLKCSANGTVLYYINGVGTIEDDALVSLAKIKKEIVDSNEKYIDKSKKVETLLIHNSTRGKFNDVAELYNQVSRNLSGQQKKEFYREKLEKDLKLTQMSEDLDGAGPVDPRLEKYANEALEYIYSKENERKPIGDKELSRLDFFKMVSLLNKGIADLLLNAVADFEVVNKIKNELILSHSKHKKVIAVAHSAGNEALRSAVYELRGDSILFPDLNKLADFDDIFGVLHVASPSPTLAVRTDHARSIKLDRDLIIKGANLILPQNSIAPTYKYENSNLSGVSKWWLIGPLIEDAYGLFGGLGFHAFDYIYLSDKVSASKIGGSSGTNTMKNIFKNNLIEVAESLGDNCLSPVIKISAPDVTEVHGKLIATGYAGPNRVIDLKVEDIGGDTNNDEVDDVPGYDRKQTEFSYKVEVVRPTSPPVVEELIEEPLSEDSNGSLQIKFNAPYRDYKYTITVTAVNYFGNKTEVGKALFIPNNRMPEATITDQVCYEGPYGSNEKGRMYYNLTTHDDSYLVDGRVRASVIEDRNYEDVISDGVNSKTVTVINQCPIKKIRYRWEVYAQCSVAYCINTSAGCDGITEPNDMFLRGTGFQTNYIRVFYPDGVPAPGAGLIGGGDNYWEAGSQGAFNDPNDFFNRITYPRASACPRDRVEDQNNEYIILRGN